MFVSFLLFFFFFFPRGLNTRMFGTWLCTTKFQRLFLRGRSVCFASLDLNTRMLYVLQERSLSRAFSLSTLSYSVKHPSLASIWTPNLSVFDKIKKEDCTNPEIYEQTSRNSITTPKLHNIETMSRLLLMVPKSVRRLLLQKCHLLPPVCPSYAVSYTHLTLPTKLSV